MKHKVSELEGALLDAAVALAEGWTWRMDGYDSEDTGERVEWVRTNRDSQPLRRIADGAQFEPSTEWIDGGPIIDRERISLISPDPQPMTFPDDSIGRDGLWHAEMMLVDALDDGRELGESGATPLIAAMRAYVASRFGDEVELL